MSDSIVLRQVRVEGCVAPGRPQRSIAAPVPDPLAARLQAGYEQGLREGREAGLRAGRAEGLEEGRAAAATDLGAAVERAVQLATETLLTREREFATAIAALRSAAEEVRSAAEEEMVALCHATLCRLVGEAFASIAGVRALVHANMAAWQARAPITVLLHPDHLAGCASEEDGAINYRADSQVGLGGCIVQGPDGALDVRLETVLQEITQALLAARGSRA